MKLLNINIKNFIIIFATDFLGTGFKASFGASIALFLTFYEAKIYTTNKYTYITINYF